MANGNTKRARSGRLSLASLAFASTALVALACWPSGSSGARPAPAASGETGGAAASTMDHEWEVDAPDHNIYFIGNRVGVGTSTPDYKIDSRTTAYSIAVYGRQNSGSGTRTGVYGVAESTAGRGVVGVASSSTGTTYGGLFDNHSISGRGVEGRASATSGATYGVSGRVTSLSSSARGVIGFGTAPADAVRAVGDLVATGVKAFEIDHPLDPENKYLLHYATEMPEPMNAYSGNVVLDETGSAWVTLPEWFQSINRDFRYQLTAIGAPAPNLHVARAIENNTFLIAGGTPGAGVSWRVEAARNDLYVRHYGAPTEFVKPAEARGRYLHPELYDLPPERGLHYQAFDQEDVETASQVDEAAHEDSMSGW